MSRIAKVNKACMICHKKKVKCDLGSGGQPCTNCRTGAYICLPHQRKRKRYTLSSSPEPDCDGKSKITQRDVPAIVPTDHTPHAANNSDETDLRANETGSGQRENHSNVDDTPATEQSYVGRSEYLGGQVPFTEEMTLSSRAPTPKPPLPVIDVQFLRIQHAFDLPPRAIRANLIDAFMQRCHPWMPILERHWLEERPDSQPSLLLLQSAFLAGSRVLSISLEYASAKDFYDRAKTLFFHGHESNTILSIIAVCLLQWWNPTGPEKISTSTSGFWIRIGVGLAFQVGLHLEPPHGPFRSFRRRLWWTLVSRDNIISVGVGRPRSINLEDSNMKAPSIDDFTLPHIKAHLFVAYVAICQLMGDIAEAHRRRTLSDSRRRDFENALFRWIKQLPPHLRLYSGVAQKSLAEYNFEVRQLHVPYFACLIILNRNPNSHAAVSTTSLFASSFMVGIMEDFISRDELRYLGPVFTFYALAAGLVQLTGYRYTSMEAIIDRELEVTNVALQQLAPRWGSADGAIRALTKTKNIVRRQQQYEGEPPPLSAEKEGFFEDFGPEICRLWYLCSAHGITTVRTQTEGLNEVNADKAACKATYGVDLSSLNSIQSLQRPHESIQASQVSPIMSQDSVDLYGMGGADFPIFNEALAPVGSWLFDDLDLAGTWDFVE